jgi:hypothetical protein
MLTVAGAFTIAVVDWVMDVYYAQINARPIYGPIPNSPIALYYWGTFFLIVFALIEGLSAYWLVQESENLVSAGVVGHKFVGVFLLPLLANLFELVHVPHLVRHDAAETVLDIVRRSTYRLIFATMFAQVISVWGKIYYIPRLPAVWALALYAFEISIMEILKSGATSRHMATLVLIVLIMLITGTICFPTQHGKHDEGEHE